MARNTIYMMKI